MRFLLSPPRFNRFGHAYDFPLGIAAVSAALKRAGHEVHCLNPNNGPGDPLLLVEEAVRRFSPDVFGTGGLSPHFQEIEAMLGAARRAKPDILNLVGGGILSADPDAVAPLLDMDLGIIGEADETVVELAAALEAGRGLEKVAGITWRQSSGDFARTRERPPLRDLATLPWSDYEAFGLEEFFAVQNPADFEFFQLAEEPRALPMVSSRSCPFACTFCFHPIGRVYRERPLDDFFAELRHLIDRHRINLLLLNDELFAAKKTRLREFCAGIRPFGIRWTAQLHASIADAEVLDMMRDSGCVVASWGLESMSNRVLDSMKKKVDRDRLETALDLTHRAKIAIQGNFIFGDSAETIETANETMDWWAAHRDYHVNLAMLQVYPGSPVYRRALAEGRVATREELIRATPTVNLTSLSEDDFKYFRNRLILFSFTLLRPHPPVVFEPDGPERPGRRELYRLGWDCPACGQRNELRRAPLDSPPLFAALRVLCRHCRHRVHLPNLARRSWIDPSAEALYREARGAREAGRLSDAVALYQRLIDKPFPTATINRPEAVIHAYRDLGEILNATGQFRRRTVYMLGEALRRKPLDPAYHALYATALAAEGSPAAAALHAQQARLLTGDGNPAMVAFLGALDQTIKAAEALHGPGCYFA